MNNHIAIGHGSMESVLRIFKCAQGHEIRVNSPVTIAWYADGENRGPAVCPHCIADFFRRGFPMVEQMQTQIAPVAPQLPMHRSGDGLASAVIMCKTEGCILAQHPEGSDHMNTGKQLFPAQSTRHPIGQSSGSGPENEGLGGK